MIAVIAIIGLAVYLSQTPTALLRITGKVIGGPAIAGVLPASQTVNLSRDVFVDINITDVTGLYGYQFTLRYNTSVLRYISITEGSFLNRGFTESTYFSNGTLNETTGTLKDVASTRTQSGEVGGSGRLARIRFTSIGEGRSFLNLTEALLSDENSQGGQTNTSNGSANVVIFAINVTEYVFVPNTITIRQGESIRWINNGTVTHTSTSDTNIWDSGNIAPQGNYVRQFSSGGSFPYHCSLHPPSQFPGFTGTIVVEAFCTDGTQYGQCSTTRPLFCSNGNLIDQCSTCGCASGQTCQPDGTCVTPSTGGGGGGGGGGVAFCSPAGARRACGSNIGICVEGTRTCVNSAWSDCVGEVAPATEVCDTEDNDCDGEVDEEVICTCTEGQTRECGTDIGACEFGMQTCIGNTWAECVGDIEPVAELLDGVDNNCNGEIDEESTLELTCRNNVKDNDEQGIDCGGSCPASCQPIPIGPGLIAFGIMLTGIMLIVYWKTK